jgi:hypothetical protein
VTATYEVLNATIGLVGANADSLRRMVRHADERAAHMAATGTYLPLKFAMSEQSKPIVFRGWKTTRSISPVTGALMTYYEHVPADITVPYYDRPSVTDSVRLPDYYVIPQEWTTILDILRLHHVGMRRLTAPETLPVEEYKLSSPKWNEKPFEGRHLVRFTRSVVNEERTFPAGTYVVPTAQRTAKVLAQLLEPGSADSFVAWGFFDAIFEQKEYYEDGVMEAIAKKMLDQDPALKREFQTKVTADSSFANNPNERLNFFYTRSPYIDRTIGVYPVVRYHGKL